jgi:hypothetical protein
MVRGVRNPISSLGETGIRNGGASDGSVASDPLQRSYASGMGLRVLAESNRRPRAGCRRRLRGNALPTSTLHPDAPRLDRIVTREPTRTFMMVANPPWLQDRLMLSTRWTYALATLLIPNCAGITGSEWERRIGYLDGNLGIPVLQSPDSVQAGQPFSVHVTTLGNSCTRPDGAEIDLDPDLPRLRVIRPFDLHRTDGICRDIGRALTREVVVRFDHPGEATIRVVGDSHPDLSNQFEARVVVR